MTALISEGYGRSLMLRPVPTLFGYLGHESGAIALDLSSAHECALHVAQAVKAAYRAATGTVQLFYVARVARSHGEVMRATPVGEDLIRALLLPFERIAIALPCHDFNPLYDALRLIRDERIGASSLLNAWTSLVNAEAHVLCDQLNAIVEDLRAAWRGDAGRAFDAARRRADGRWRSVKHAVKEANAVSPRLTVIRLDLYCQRSKSAGSPLNSPSPPDHKRMYDWVTRFQRRLRASYPLVRFIRLLEWTPATGFQYRFLILLNGYLAPDDASIARDMASSWIHGITGGLGRCAVLHSSVQREGWLSSDHGPANEGSGMPVLSLASSMVRTDTWVRFTTPAKALVVSMNRRARRSRTKRGA